MIVNGQSFLYGDELLLLNTLAIKQTLAVNSVQEAELKNILLWTHDQWVEIQVLNLCNL